MPDQTFHSITIHGGQPIFGDHNHAHQVNYGDRRDEMTPLLDQLRRATHDPAAAEPSIAAIEQAIRQPGPDVRSRIDRALTDLARHAGNARTALEAITAIGAIAASVWPG